MINECLLIETGTYYVSRGLKITLRLMCLQKYKYNPVYVSSFEKVTLCRKFSYVDIYV